MNININMQLSKFRLALGATALLAAALAPSYAFAAEEKESATVGQGITDTAISTKLRAKLLADKRIKKSDVDVNTTDRVVTLTGTAASSDVKAAAESIASQQEGVSSVDNKLVVAAKPAVGERVERKTHQASAVVSDGYIKSKVKSKLLAARGVHSSGIEVETNGGVVTLSGHVRSASEQRKAIAIAKGTRGVKSVEAGNLEIAAK